MPEFEKENEKENEVLKKEIPDFHINELGYMLEVMLARAREPKDLEDERMAFISALRFAYMLLQHESASEADKSLARLTCLTIISVLQEKYPLEVPNYEWN